MSVLASVPVYMWTSPSFQTCYRTRCRVVLSRRISATPKELFHVRTLHTIRTILDGVEIY